MRRAGVGDSDGVLAVGRSEKRRGTPHSTTLREGSRLLAEEDATGSAEILLAFGGGHGVTRPTLAGKRQTGFLETRTFLGVG